METFRARYYEIDPESKPSLAALAREALACCPNNEEALWWLFEAVDTINAVQSWELLQQGVAARHRSFVLELARRAPKQLTAQNVAALERDAAPCDGLLLAHVDN